MSTDTPAATPARGSAEDQGFSVALWDVIPDFDVTAASGWTRAQFVREAVPALWKRYPNLQDISPSAMGTVHLRLGPGERTEAVNLWGRVHVMPGGMQNRIWATLKRADVPGIDP